MLLVKLVVVLAHEDAASCETLCQELNRAQMLDTELNLHALLEIANMKKKLLRVTTRQVCCLSSRAQGCFGSWKVPVTCPGGLDQDDSDFGSARISISVLEVQRVSRWTVAERILSWSEEAELIDAVKEMGGTINAAAANGRRFVESVKKSDLCARLVALQVRLYFVTASKLELQDGLIYEIQLD